MKKISALFSTLLLTVLANAQTLQEAITKTENERFESAAADFKALIAKDASKGDYYFYFGENYFKNNLPDSAIMMYKKGGDVQPTNPLNFIGIGKVLLYQGKDQEANTNLFKAKTLAAKNATALLKLAEVYINVPAPYKNFTEANKLLADAMKLEPKNPEVYLLVGDALLEQNPTDGTPAINSYNKALELNPKSPKGILRKGKLYLRARNYNLALEFYKQAEAVDPNFAPAYFEKSELYHLAGQEAKSLEAIKKYLELNGNSLSARKKYAGQLYLNKQYAEAIKEIEEIVTKAPNDCYMWRILGYSYYELGNATDKDAFTKGLDAINKFFTCTEGKKDFKFIPDDYKYKGQLLGKIGQDSLGASEIEKAIASDPVKNCELNGEIGKIYVKAKKWEKAIIYYEKKVLCPNLKELTGVDNFDLGRAYYYLGGMKEKEAAELKDAATKGKKETEAAELFVKADTCFSRLTRISPTFSTGFFFRGLANVHLDLKNEKFLAKPHFEKAISLVKPEERSLPSNKNNAIIACEYLGYYYLKNKDNAKAKEYFNIVKELDPVNKKAIEFFKSPEGK